MKIVSSLNGQFLFHTMYEWTSKPSSSQCLFKKVHKINTNVFYNSKMTQEFKDKNYPTVQVVLGPIIHVQQENL